MATSRPEAVSTEVEIESLAAPAPVPPVLPAYQVTPPAVPARPLAHGPAMIRDLPAGQAVSGGEDCPACRAVAAVRDPLAPGALPWCVQCGIFLRAESVPGWQAPPAGQVIAGPVVGGVDPHQVAPAPGPAGQEQQNLAGILGGEALAAPRAYVHHRG